MESNNVRGDGIGCRPCRCGGRGRCHEVRTVGEEHEARWPRAGDAEIQRAEPGSLTCMDGWKERRGLGALS